MTKYHLDEMYGHDCVQITPEMRGYVLRLSFVIFKYTVRSENMPILA